MTISFKGYTVDIINGPNYSLGSTDNSLTYDRVYFEDTEYPTSKHGLRITRNGRSVASVIICESDGTTGMRNGPQHSVYCMACFSQRIGMGRPNARTFPPHFNFEVKIGVNPARQPWQACAPLGIIRRG